MYAMLLDIDWKTEILKRLDILAEKLGTTAGYLWHVLVKQGVVIGIEDCLIGLTWFVFWLVVLNFAKKLRTTIAESSNHEEECVGFGWALGICCNLMWLIIGTYIFDGIAELINPEFYALQNILQTLGK
jgi:hypothetical protein